MNDIDPYDPNQEHADPAVQVLINQGWLGEWDAPIAVADLENAARHVREADAKTGFAELTRFGEKVPTGWRFEFPNGHTVSVINDLHRPFRFETLSDDPADFDRDRGGVTPNLTSEQVERKLATIYALPTQG